MAKIYLTICDIKPCKNTADRHFQINGQTLHVCGEVCYAKYWSREYQKWKGSPYDLQASYTTQATSFDDRRLTVVSNS